MCVRVYVTGFSALSETSTDQSQCLEKRRVSLHLQGNLLEYFTLHTSLLILLILLLRQVSEVLPSIFVLCCHNKVVVLLLLLNWETNSSRRRFLNDGSVWTSFRSVQDLLGTHMTDKQPFDSASSPSALSFDSVIIINTVYLFSWLGYKDTNGLSLGTSFRVNRRQRNLSPLKEPVQFFGDDDRENASSEDSSASGNNIQSWQLE